MSRKSEKGNSQPAATKNSGPTKGAKKGQPYATARAALTEVDFKSAEASVKNLLEVLGEDPTREGLLKTPQRAARAFGFLTSGYTIDPDELLKRAVFTEDYDQMVVVKDIEFYSLCEHHLVPFFGKAHIAYIPDGKIVGLSKIARLVNVYSRRFQVQERLTKQIATKLNEVLGPLGVAVVLEAQHLCMMMRGVEKEGSLTITSQMCGEFQTNDKTRMEFLKLIAR